MKEEPLQHPQAAPIDSCNKTDKNKKRFTNGIMKYFTAEVPHENGENPDFCFHCVIRVVN